MMVNRLCEVEQAKVDAIRARLNVEYFDREAAVG
jgi:hypothetical protein